MKRKLAMFWLIICGILAELTAYAAAANAPVIQVVGLFKDTAIIRQDKRETLLRVGMNSGNGLKLIEANSEQAVFEYRGRRFTHALTDSPVISIDSTPSRTQEVRLLANNGMYMMSGMVNGHYTDFVLDTGATYVTLGARQANQLGIDYLNTGKKVQLNTANGKADAWLVKLDKVQVGEVEVSQVVAAIMENMGTDKALLGMSFLSNVSMSNEGQVMLLQKKP